MPRAVKTFATVEPTRPEIALPKHNSFTIDLGGLDLSDDQLNRVNQAATRAAMVAAAQMAGQRLANAMDGFATFATFSTFSTFGSGAAFERPEISQLPQEVSNIIARAAGGGG